MGPHEYVGRQVRCSFSNDPNDTDEDKDIVECGTIVAAWFDSQMDAIDCYIAFYGTSFPEGKPSEEPYILRYFENSLEPVVAQPLPHVLVGHRVTRSNKDCGMVVAGWEDQDEIIYCYVAIFGKSFPDGKPKKPEMILCPLVSLDLVLSKD